MNGDIFVSQDEADKRKAQELEAIKKAAAKARKRRERRGGEVEVVSCGVCRSRGMLYRTEDGYRCGEHRG